MNQSLKADRTAGRGRTTSRWTHRGSPGEDNGAHSAASPGLTSGEVGQFESRALERVCLREGFANVWRLGRQASEPQGGGTRLLGYCLPLLGGPKGKVGQERHPGSRSPVSLLPSLQVAFPFLCYTYFPRSCTQSPNLLLDTWTAAGTLQIPANSAFSPCHRLYPNKKP